MKRIFTVTGMSCAACSARVEKAVRGVPGVEDCAVSLLTNEMSVEGPADDAAVVAAVEAAGLLHIREADGAALLSTRPLAAAGDGWQPLPLCTPLAWRGGVRAFAAPAHRAEYVAAPATCLLLSMNLPSMAVPPPLGGGRVLSLSFVSPSLSAPPRLRASLCPPPSPSAPLPLCASA